MDLHTVKFGIGIAACCVAGISVLFAAYWKMGEMAVKKTEKKNKI